VAPGQDLETPREIEVSQPWESVAGKEIGCIHIIQLDDRQLVEVLPVWDPRAKTQKRSVGDAGKKFVERKITLFSLSAAPEL